MNFSNPFRAVWWFLLLVGLGLYLFVRYGQISGGTVNWFDGLVFLSWLGLALGPLFNEIDIFGFKLKNELKNLKDHVTREIGSIRSEIRVNSENTQTMSPNFMFGYPPPPDSQLHNLETRIKQAVEEAMVGRERPPQDVEAFIADPNSPGLDVLFKARYSIEKELRAIYELANIDKKHRRMPIHRLIQPLVENAILEPSLANAAREVYSVCSPALHGEEVSEAQVEFVRNTAPELISALKAISSGMNWEYCT